MQDAAHAGTPPHNDPAPPPTDPTHTPGRSSTRRHRVGRHRQIDGPWGARPAGHTPDLIAFGAGSSPAQGVRRKRVLGARRVRRKRVRTREKKKKRGRRGRCVVAPRVGEMGELRT